MSIQTRISAFTDLGQFFKAFLSHDFSEDSDSSENDFKFETFSKKLKEAEYQNPWFTPENLNHSLKYWASVLTKDNLEQWTSQYSFSTSPKKVGIIMAGNIPMVGFHDLLSVSLSGNDALVKTSSKDKILMEFIIDFLSDQSSDFITSIQKVDRLEGHDAIIATGSNNTARYFEYYFGKIPRIIRKNRTSVAVLKGDETPEDLKELAKDIFQYFGLGCRNVTKIYIPKNFNTDLLFESFMDWKEVIHHTKYGNNYDYNRTVYLMSKENQFLDNNFVILKQSKDFHSPIGVIYYEFYEDLEKLEQELDSHKDGIQCIVGRAFPTNDIQVDFGKTQYPALTDYADGVNVMEFLESINNS